MADTSKKQTPQDSSEPEPDTNKAQLDDSEDTERPEWDVEDWSHSQAETESDASADEKTVDIPDKTVDEIVQNESDQALKKEDEDLEKAFTEKPSLKTKLLSWFHVWWDNPKYRYGSLGSLAVLLILLFAIPLTRYGILNGVGVRATARVVVLDQQTQLPLKNVQIQLGGVEAQTDRMGEAVLSKVRLGSQSLQIEKVAYDGLDEKVTVGLGSNHFVDKQLVSVGTRYTFVVTDWLSGKPVVDAEASYGENSALSDEDGVIQLNTVPEDVDNITVTISAEEYRDFKAKIAPSKTDDTAVSLVVNQPDYFVSEREGRYDVYKIDADGSNEELILAGSGNETDAIRFTVSPDGSTGVLSSTREGARNGDGYLLQSLYTINLKTKKFKKIDQSEYIDLAGWIGNQLIYVKIAEGASGTNPERHRLVTYNIETASSKQIAASNYFNDVLVTKDYVFYAPSDAFKENPKPYLFRSNGDGSQLETVFEREVWQVVRSDRDSLYFDSRQEWYKTDVDDLVSVKQDGPPANRISRIYTPSPDGKKALWVDQRDGKGVLLLENADDLTDKETILSRQGGLRNPLRWLSSKHVVYRIVSDSETADYVVNIDGGDPVKISDVSNVAGTDLFYYYY